MREMTQIVLPVWRRTGSLHVGPARFAKMPEWLQDHYFEQDGGTYFTPRDEDSRVIETLVLFCELQSVLDKAELLAPSEAAQLFLNPCGNHRFIADTLTEDDLHDIDAMMKRKAEDLESYLNSTYRS